MSKKNNLDSNLKLRQYKQDLWARFLQINSVNRKLKQDQIAKELGCSSSTLKRNRSDINMFSLFRIPSNGHKRGQKFSNIKLDDDSNRKHDVKRPQMTANELKRLNSLNPTQIQTLLSITQRIRETNWKLDPFLRVVKSTTNR